MAPQQSKENDAREDSSEAESGRGDEEYSGEKNDDLAEAAEKEEEEDGEDEEDDWEQWEFEELGDPSAAHPSGGWFGEMDEICREIAVWAGCPRVWENYGEDGEDLLDRCPSCSVESRSYDSGSPGGSGYDYMVRTKDGPTFRKEFRREVLTLYRQNR